MQKESAFTGISVPGKIKWFLVVSISNQVKVSGFLVPPATHELVIADGGRMNSPPPPPAAETALRPHTRLGYNIWEDKYEACSESLVTRISYSAYVYRFPTSKLSSPPKPFHSYIVIV